MLLWNSKADDNDGAEGSAESRFSQSPLFVAINNGYVTVVELLLEQSRMNNAKKNELLAQALRKA